MLSLARSTKTEEQDELAADIARFAHPESKTGSIKLKNGRFPTMAGCVMLPIPGGTVWGGSISGASGVFVCRDTKNYLYFVPGVLVFAQGQAFKTLGARADSILIDDNPARTVPRIVCSAGMNMEDKKQEAAIIKRETYFRGPPPFGRVSWRASNVRLEPGHPENDTRQPINVPLIDQSFTDVSGKVWASMKDAQSYTQWLPKAAQEYVYALSASKD